eukprot:2236933-Ditylum_brightwellii.AAC.1
MLNSYRKRQKTSQPATKQTELTTAIEKSSIDYIPGLNTDIPELDALLSATELHDGLEHEMCVQRLLLWMWVRIIEIKDMKSSKTPH